MASAAAGADGPGTTSTGYPAAAAASTSCSPGSESDGMPASETRATVSPRPSRSRRSLTRERSRGAGQEMRGPARPTREASFAVTRVSSQKMASASERARAARGERSSRFPIGVPTITSLPALAEVIRSPNSTVRDAGMRGVAGILPGRDGYHAEVRSILAFLLLASALALTADIVDRIAATVNDVAIPESEVRKAIVVSALQPEAGESPEAFRGRVHAGGTHPRGSPRVDRTAAPHPAISPGAFQPGRARRRGEGAGGVREVLCSGAAGRGTRGGSVRVGPGGSAEALAGTHVRRGDREVAQGPSREGPRRDLPDSGSGSDGASAGRPLVDREGDADASRARHTDADGQSEALSGN